MGFHGSLMVSHGSPVGFRILPVTSMGFGWTFIEFHESLVGPHGLPRTSMGLPRALMGLP